MNERRPYNVRPSLSFYQERDADRLLLGTIRKNESFPSIYSPLKVGKTRILQETSRRLNTTGEFHCALIHMHCLGPVWESCAHLMYELCYEAFRELHLGIDLFEKENKKKYRHLSEEKLRELLISVTSEKLQSKRIVIFIDHIEVLYERRQPSRLALQFLQTLKACKPIQFVFSATNPFWQNDLLKAGMGTTIPLNPFSMEEIEAMLMPIKETGLCYPSFGEDIQRYTGGSPYLMQLLLGQLWRDHIEIGGWGKLDEKLEKFGLAGELKKIHYNLSPESRSAAVDKFNLAHAEIVEKIYEKITPETVSAAAGEICNSCVPYFGYLRNLLCQYSRCEEYSTKYSTRLARFLSLFSRQQREERAELQETAWLTQKSALEFLQAIGLTDDRGQFRNEFYRRYFGEKGRFSLANTSEFHSLFE